MYYLVCRKCKGYYKLQKGESIKDFGECECGGTLKHAVFGALETESFGAEEMEFPPATENQGRQKFKNFRGVKIEVSKIFSFALRKFVEFLGDFDRFSSDLKYVKYDYYPHKGFIYIENEPEHTKRNLKLPPMSFFNLKVLYVISLLVMLSFLYLFNLITLIMDYSLLISIILILVLILRYILEEINTENMILKFLADRTIFLIIPLLLMFIGIIIYSAMTV
jgi:hypothetical protein